MCPDGGGELTTVGGGVGVWAGVEVVEGNGVTKTEGVGSEPLGPEEFGWGSLEALVTEGLGEGEGVGVNEGVGMDVSVEAGAGE